MRRKQKYGVYSNKTIKKCQCFRFCGTCRGFCKEEFEKHCEINSVGHDLFYQGRRKLHYFGVGSLMPGKKFIPYEKNHSFTWRSLRIERMKKDIKRRSDLKKKSFEEHDYYLTIKSLIND